jgi:UDPglucose 6-dehydrogenase
MKVGIIGQGFVGGAIKEKFKEHFEVYAYDKLWRHVKSFKDNYIVTYRDTSDARKVVEECEIIFVCLPTPMYMDSGECDTSIVRDVIVELDNFAVELGVNRTAIIKSTVPPGTTQSLNSLCANLNVCFSPEFLTEANAVEDFNSQDRIVIGSDDKHQHIIDMFKECFPDANYFPLSTKEAEMVKYTANLFLATKVSFFNDIYNVCRGLDIDYDHVVNVAITDKRIGKSHFSVPGPDGDRGFGGHCFPKDTAAIMYIAGKMGVDIPTIRGMWTTNERVRENKDWEDMDGRAVTKTKKKQLK